MLFNFVVRLHLALKNIVRNELFLFKNFVASHRVLQMLCFFMSCQTTTGTGPFFRHYRAENTSQRLQTKYTVYSATSLDMSELWVHIHRTMFSSQTLVSTSFPASHLCTVKHLHGLFFGRGDQHELVWPSAGAELVPRGPGEGLLVWIVLLQKQDVTFNLLKHLYSNKYFWFEPAKANRAFISWGAEH